MFRAFMSLVALLIASLALQLALAADTAQGARADVNDMQLYFEVSGEGPPLIVLHGAHMNSGSMGGIIPRLAQRHRVYALELQGHRRTNDIDRPITSQHLANDVAASMQAAGLERADIFGYSTGASTGLQLAIRHPGRVNKLVLASVPHSLAGWQPAYQAFIPQMTSTRP